MGGAERKFTAHWEVTEVNPRQRLSYNWNYNEYNGQGSVTFTLQEVEKSTVVPVHNYGLESFPEEIPEFTEESCRNGGRYFIHERLPSYFKR